MKRPYSKANGIKIKGAIQWNCMSLAKYHDIPKHMLLGFTKLLMYKMFVHHVDRHLSISNPSGGYNGPEPK